MAWCPKCRNEYREGIKVCADCGCELVDKEPLGDVKPLIYGNQEWMTSLKEYLEYNEIDPVVMVKREGEEVYLLLIPEADYDKGVKLSQVYLANESKRQAQIQATMMAETAVAEGRMTEEEKAKLEAQIAMENDEKVQRANQKAAAAQAKLRGNSGAYKKSSEKAEENRSSAWVLLGAGILGITAMVLGMLGIIPFSLGNPIMFYSVMCGLFLIFIVMGFVSLKNAKELAKKAESEDSLQNTLLTWCKENLKAEIIDADIPKEQEEVVYFYRFEKIKNSLNAQFVNLDQTFLEHLIDTTVYEMVFGEENE